MGIDPNTHWSERARVTTTAGDVLILRERAGGFEIRCNGWELMSSRAYHSETRMAELTCARLSSDAPRLLIGGLGMGFMLRAALDRLPGTARVTVAELVPEIVAWNRDVLGDLAGHPLRDPRVTVACADVAELLSGSHRFDAIMLDVDNGPDAVMLDGNAPLYTTSGLRRTGAALVAGGTLAVWSADVSAAFERNLGDAGFLWEAHALPARGGPDDPLHTIYLAWN